MRYVSTNVSLRLLLLLLLLQSVASCLGCAGNAGRKSYKCTVCQCNMLQGSQPHTHTDSKPATTIATHNSSSSNVNNNNNNIWWGIPLPFQLLIRTSRSLSSHALSSCSFCNCVSVSNSSAVLVFTSSPRYSSSPGPAVSANTSWAKFVSCPLMVFRLLFSHDMLPAVFVPLLRALFHNIRYSPWPYMS